jgi:hypothetical protein
MRWRTCTLARKPRGENAEDGGASRHIHRKSFEVMVEVNNAGWLPAAHRKRGGTTESSGEEIRQRSLERANAMDDDQLWERDVYRIFFVVLSDDEQPLALSSDFCALADCVSPQAVMRAQLHVRVDLEDGSWPRHHVVPCNVPKIFQVWTPKTDPIAKFSRGTYRESR